MRFSFVSIVMVLAVGVGCAKKDTEAPPAPVVKAARSRTALDKVVLRGTAEYGAKLAITRDPAADGALAPDGFAADPFTAAFELEVPLATGDNVFSITAADAAGNVSAPGSVTVTRTKAAPASLSLTSSATLLDADRATVLLVAQLSQPEGLALAGMEVAFKAQHEDASVPAVEATGKADGLGRARATLAKLSRSGLWTVTATSKEDPSIVDSVGVLVAGGAPASMELTLSSSDAAGAPVTGKSIVVPPASAIRAKVALKDEPQNPVDGTFTLYTDAPGALVAGDGVSGVTRAVASPYRVVAVVQRQGRAGAALVTAEATFQVVAGKASAVAVEPRVVRVAAGTPVTFTAAVVDAYGNARTDGADLSVAPAPAKPATPIAATVVTIESAGSYTVTATSKSDPTAKGSATLTVIPGPAATVSLALFKNSLSTALADPVVISVGDTLTAKATVTDAYGNPASEPALLTSNIAGAVIQGSQIVDISQSGTYRVVSAVNGQSPFASRTVQVKPGAPVRLELAASASQAVAGQQVQLTPAVFDSFGNPVLDAVVTLASSPALAPTFTPPGSTQVLNQGFVGTQTFVAYDLSGVAGTGYQFSLTGTVAGATPALSKSIPLEVRPGSGASFKLVDDLVNPGQKIPDFLFTSGCAGAVASCTGVSVAAGTDIAYQYAVVDRYGNAATTPISVFTDAPGAQIIDDGVSGTGTLGNLSFARQTSYSLTAYIAGVPGGLKRTFFVGTAAPADVGLSLSSTLVSLSANVRAVAVVRDRFGNPVACPATNPVSPTVMDITATPASATASPLTCLGGVFTRTFTFSKEGSYAIDATYKTGPVTNSAYVSVVGFDNTAPTIVIQNVLVAGQPCAPGGIPQLCNAAPGDAIDFDAVATDNISLSEVSYGAFFGSTQTLRARTVLVGSNVTSKIIHFTFNVPGGALPELVALAAQAVDGAGNRSNSPETTLSITLAARALGGRTLTVVTSGGRLNRPEDVAVRANGDLVIANTGNNEILKLTPGGAPGLFTSLGGGPRFVSVDSTDRTYVSRGNTVDRLSSNGAAIETFWNAGRQTDAVVLTAPSTQRANVGVSFATDGSSVALDVGRPTEMTYQLDSPGGIACTGTATRTCVAFTLGAPSPNAATNLAAAINANSASRVTAVTAGGVISLESKSVGEPVAGSTDIPVAGNGNVTVSGAFVSEGHGEELWASHLIDTNVYRFQLFGNPFNGTGTNHGSFDTLDLQHSLAVRDIWKGPTDVNFDQVVYSLPDGTNTDIWARRYRGNSSLGANAGTTTIFRLNQASGGFAFQGLWDMVLSPNGQCLIFTDEAAGSVYAANVAAPLSSTPVIQLVANRFLSPRGVALDAGGNLLVVDRDANVVYRLSPLASPAPGCF